MMELDVYLPKEKLAFEYQGEAHYHDVYSQGNRWIQKQQDEEKSIKCRDNGITLLVVPYWWDFEKSSLIATIRKERSELLTSQVNGDPIPHRSAKAIPEGSVIGNLPHFEEMRGLMNGEVWDGKQNLEGWYPL